jgi:hypothetical protein
MLGLNQYMVLAMNILGALPGSLGDESGLGGLVLIARLYGRTLVTGCLE